ncbi:flagellar biosynthetic protein [Bordetella ansorpii]|uniref:Flagellar biosynthetic protein FliR n=1 Tax=Bordetella ansorpii TaxID=288768 RepID=A0A157M306_9BORD|nr:flagellar biosynthetic protein FliR [Bordetella ansorpii]SAI02979.1 flagellar biosynthetic protein [Bordetella ansorpii]
MISFTLEQLTGWIGMYLWPFIRMAALVGASPLFSESSIPTPTKIGVAFMLTVALAPALGPMPAVPLNSYAALWIVLQQILIGVSIGLVMRIVFAAVQTAGEFVGLQMSLSFASFFDPSVGANTAVLSRLFNLIAMLVFLSLDGHLLMLTALARSFEVLPVSVNGLDPNGWGVLLEWGNTIFTAGLLLALPLICSQLTVNLALGILNRASPQLTVFAIGFPIHLIGGLILLAVVLPHSGPFFEDQFQLALRTIGELVLKLAGR